MPAFLDLQLPLPDVQTQNRIVRVYSDVGVLQAALTECLDVTGAWGPHRKTEILAFTISQPFLVIGGAHGGRYRKCAFSATRR
jgi:hypothetical protein